MVQVVTAPEFDEWFADLPKDQVKAVARYVLLLEQHGVTLGHPYSSAIEGTSLALRELRVKHASSAIRVFYVFDPERRAVLLLGGDKSNDKRFYGRMIKKAEELYRRHLASMRR